MGFVNLKFLPHAVERMAERKISVREIEEILSFPDGKIFQTKDKAIYYKRLIARMDNLVAAVAVEIGPDNTFEIITVLVNFEVKKESNK